MNDQARQLRELVIRDALEKRAAPRRSLRQACFLSQSSGDTTAIALNVALVLARLGRRVALVTTRGTDADSLLQQQLFERLEGSEQLGHPLWVGPFGLRLIEGNQSPASLGLLAPVADFLLIDGVDVRLGLPSEGIDSAVYVTTPANGAILDTYAAIKAQPQGIYRMAVATRCDVESDGWEALQRLCSTCASHGDRVVEPAAVICNDDLRELGRARPPVLQSPTSALTRRLERIAAKLTDDAPHASSRALAALKSGS